MPYKCSVPGCRGNYNNGPKVHVFRFPTDYDLKQKWLTAIPRYNLEPGQYTRVCEVHFDKDNIVWTVTEQIEKTGEVVTNNLKRPRLKEGSVPSIFPNCSSKSVKKRKCKDNGLQTLQEAVDVSEQQCLFNTKSMSFQNFEEFLKIFNTFEIPNDWFSANDGDKVILFKLEYTPGPSITWAIVINNDLKIETFLYGEALSISASKLKTPFVSNTLDDIKILLDTIDESIMIIPFTKNAFIDSDISDSDNASNDNQSNKLNKIKRVFKFVIDILDNYKSFYNDKFEQILNFICEQLTLLTTANEVYRYSPNTMILCSIVLTINPNAYKYLIDHGPFILPHPETVKCVCNKFLTDPHIDERKIFLTHARNVFRFVNDKERYVTLLFDAVHIEPYLDCTGGHGTAVNEKALASSAFTFTISSVCSNFKEVVHVAPMSKITSEILYNFLKILIENLEEIGYIVFGTVSDNNAINIKAMNHFSPTHQLSIVYLHPVDPTRPLFYLFDSVNLLISIFNNWLNSKPYEILAYPDFDTKEIKYASFDAVKNLYEREYDKLLKFGLSVTLKGLFPLTLKRQDAKLALNLFDHFIIEALRGYGSNTPNSHATADFIKIIMIWWRIVNVKTPLKDKHDMYPDPTVKKKFTDYCLDPKIDFLQKMLNWLDTWKLDNFSNSFTRQTHTALSHNIYGLLEITKYCLEELNINYLLLGKFQLDLLACGHYHMSIPQLYESEKRIRIQSMLTLKSRNFGDIYIDKFYEIFENDREESHFHQNNTQLPKIIIENYHFEQIIEKMPVITYLGGYCCYVTLNKLNCDYCKEKLVYDEQLIVEDRYDLINKLNREGLLYPREEIIEIVSLTYIIFNILVKEFEDLFLEKCNKKTLLIRLLLDYLIEQKYVLTYFEGCSNHNEQDIAKIILNSISNTLIRNYCGKRSYRIGIDKKRKLDIFTY